jgi:MFS family permease
VSRLDAPGQARVALTAVFFANGTVFGTLAARIPTIKADLGLGAGELGVALLGVPVGAMLMMPVSGWLSARAGSRPATRVAIVLEAVAMMLVAFAGDLATLTIALLALGATNSMLDVAMNAHGVTVEGRRGRPILSSLHAAWSFGGLAGAAGGGIAAAADLGLRVHFGLVALTMFGGALLWSARLLPGHEDTAPAARLLTRPPRRIVLLGLTAFCCLFAEGAAADWSAVYLDDPLSTGPGLAAAAYAAFSLTMAVGRLVGDRLSVRWGAAGVVFRGGALGGGALALALVIAQPAAAIIGFAALGAGLAAVVPSVFRAAGTVPGTSASQGIAAASVIGYLGLVSGPPIIGAVAEGVGLPLALGIVALLTAALMPLSLNLRPERVAGRDGERALSRAGA